MITCTRWRAPTLSWRAAAGAIACAALVCMPRLALAQSVAELLRDGRRAYDTDKYDRAEDLFKAALDGARGDGNAADEAEARTGIGLVLYQRAKYGEARAELERALATFEASGDEAGIARLSRHLGAVAMQAGDQAEARRRYEQALAIAEQHGLNDEKARALSLLAYLPGPTERRLEMVDDALKLSRSLGLRELEGVLLHQRGDHLFVSGRFAEAQEDLDRAAAIFEATSSRSELARVLTSLGRLYRAHGQMDRALDCYRRGLAIQEEIGDRQGAIQSINSIATALGTQNKLKEAHALYERGLVLAEQTGSPRLINFMRGNLGGSYLSLGDYVHARELLEAAAAQPMDPYIAVYRYSALTTTYLALKEFPRAVDAAERAVAAVRQGGQLERLPEALLSRAEAHKASGQLREALADTAELLDSIEQLRSKLAPNDSMKRGFSDVWANSYTLIVQLHHELGDHAGAIEAAEAARARAFVDLLATRNVQGKPSDRDRLADLHRLDGELKAVGVDPAAPAAQLTFRGSTSSTGPSALVRRWRSADPELRSFVDAEPLSIGQVVDTAKRLHSTVLTYWVGPGQTFIGVVRPDGQVRTVSIDVPEARVSALARATQPGAAGGDRPSPPAKAAWSPRARGSDVLAISSGGREARRELYRLLIAPVIDLLPRENGALLTIVPHGPLFLVSFAALIDERGSYLLERFTIHYAPSSAVLQYTSGKKHTAGAPRYLLVGDPADLPAGDDGKPLPPLPGSHQEVEAIARSLRGRDVTLLTGVSAHEQQVREQLSGRTILHFATHGVVRDDEPFDSFLAFGRSSADSPGDGRLTAQEIYDLDLHADLVILSACRTGAGRVTGDGIIGLTRAFLYAGTPRVIATLWDVADEPGLFLLPALYGALDRGEDGPRALRTAQLKFLAQLRAGRVQVNTVLGRVTLPEDPLLWAGFVLVGEP